MWMKPPAISGVTRFAVRRRYGFAACATTARRPSSRPRHNCPLTRSRDDGRARHASAPGRGTRPGGTCMSEPGHWFERNPLWFKTATFYEIHIRGFYDGNDDGSGDFRGLIDKL